MPRYCTRCILPDTRPGVALDGEGVCSGCRHASAKSNIDWAARAADFGELVRNIKGRRARYDCVIPVSGGKDSFWQVVTSLEHGLHPLCVTYVYPGRSKLGEHNLRRLIALGVDHMEFRLSPKVERVFIKKAFEKQAMSGLVANMAIFSIPVQVAAAYDIPLVLYGENSAFEYGSRDERLTGARLDRSWLKSFGVSNGTSAEDWVDAELSRQDLELFFLPSDEVLRAKDLHVLFLGHYFAWDPETSRQVAMRHGFEARAEGPRVGHYNFVNIDDDMIGVHHHPKWHKFGITRSWDTLSMEIRAGRLTREQAIAKLAALGDETPEDDIRLFCEYLGMSRREYDAVLERFRNPQIWTRRDERWQIDGFLIPGFDWR